MLLALSVTACAGDTAPAAIEVERTDSAGVEIVMNRGGDVPLEWRFEEVLRLGGADDGPEAFFEIRSHVGVDGEGNIFVLDGGNHRVLVFDPAGEHTRTVGSRGGGPGEFERTSAFGVQDDGTVLLYDIGKRSVMRWGPEGDALPSEPLDASFVSGRMVVVEDRPVGEVPDDDAPAGTRVREILTLDADAHRFARQESPVGDVIQFDGCPVLFPAQKLLLPGLLWDATDGEVAVSDAAPYEVRIVAADGRVRRHIRRDVAVRETTADDATAELAEDFRLTFGGEGGGGECRIPREDVVEKQGYADVIPAIRALRAAPDGTLWLNRASPRAEHTMIDLISVGGEYLGTLPPDAPWPTAFTPDGAPISVERDDFDLEYVVVYRVERG